MVVTLLLADYNIRLKEKKIDSINQSRSTEFNPANATKNTAIKSINSAVSVLKNSIKR